MGKPRRTNKNNPPRSMPLRQKDEMQKTVELVKGLPVLYTLRVMLAGHSDYIMLRVTEARQETSTEAKALREEVAVNLKAFGDTITRTMFDNAAAQKAQQDSFSVQIQKLTETNESKLSAVEEVLDQRLAALQEDNGNKLDQMRVGTVAANKELRDEVNLSLKNFNDSVLKTMTQLSEAQSKELEAFSTQLQKLTETNEGKLTAVKEVLEQRLAAIQEDNSNKLDQMRLGTNSANKDMRDEVNLSLKNFNDSVLKTMTQLSDAQTREMEAFSTQFQKLTETNEGKLTAVREVLEQRLAAIQEDNSNKLDQMRLGTINANKDMRDEVNLSLKNFNDSVLKTMTQLSDAQTREMETFSTQLGILTESNQARLETLKMAVEAKLQSLQEDNAKQLDQMRATVDEKLQGTLEKRLGESFRQVSERLEQVSKGLGEMQSLATGVGDLKRVLTNVKARGTWGEVQLGNLLEQVLSPEQYEANVAPKGGPERVEFAVKLPGRTGNVDEVVWLPIDAKWPAEDYQRLTDAQERADAAAAEAAILQLELRIKQCAKDISERYLNPPQTTDFGILFLPTEGLFAEVIRRTALVEILQTKYRVIVAGPTTLWSILSSLQMGFKTLAIQKRSSEVWTLLAAVKSEWSKYGAVLTKVQKKLQEASNTMEDANRRNRAVGRKLRDVQELPSNEAAGLLLLDSALNIEADDETESESLTEAGTTT